MKSYRKELWFNVPTRRAFLNITLQVQACLSESGISEGLILVNVGDSPLTVNDIVTPVAMNKRLIP
jgi:thiamine phosphate synthase YjbQ (UPF0047 family)